MTLDEFGTEMTALCAQLRKVDSMTEVERANLSRQAEGLCSELESDYGVPAFKPEVPAETQKAFFTLAKHIGFDY